MTQILAYSSTQGIVLGTDSRAQHYHEDGSITHLAVNKLFQLSPRMMLATAGAGYGIALCQAFQTHVQRKNLWQFDEVCYQALPFFRSELERFKRESRLPAGRHDLARVYFLIAGQNLTHPEECFQLHLLGSEQQDDPLHRIRITEILAIPRQLGLESKLFQFHREKRPLGPVRTVMKRFLLRLTKQNQEVGPPLHVVSITQDGIKADRFPPKETETGNHQLPTDKTSP